MKMEDENMSPKEDQGRVAERGFAKVARQLNYTRTFVSSHEARVTIPTLPYELFMASGEGVLLWHLMRLLESCRAFTFWPVPQDPLTPNMTLVDSHRLLTENLAFIASIQVDIHKNFHSYVTPKFPLQVNVKVLRVRKSTKRISYTLSHESQSEPYVTCLIDDVLVSESTRRPISYPQWWMDKYRILVSAEKDKLMERLVLPNEVVKDSVEVCYSDIDSNGHTNFASYLKWGFQTWNKHFHRTGQAEQMSALVKTVRIIFLGESNLGDILRISVWTNGKMGTPVMCVVDRPEARHCCHFMMELYPVIDSCRL